MLWDAILILVSLGLGMVLLLGLFLSPIAAALAVRGIYRGLVRLARYPSRGRWSRAVAQLGFLDAGDRVMAGRLRGHAVRIEELWLGLVKRGTRLTVDCDGLLPPDLELARRSLRTGPTSGKDLGDPELHRAVYLAGPDAVLLAALGKTSREAVLAACAAGAFRAHLSTVTLEASGSAERLPGLAEKLVRAVGGLAATRSPAKALASHVESEPVDAVRLKNLEALLLEYPERTETARACEAALGDAVPQIRLLAAAHLGGERGFAVLEELVEVPGLPAPMRVEALRALAKVGIPSPHRGLLSRALDDPEPRVRLAATWLAGKLKDGTQLERVCELAQEGPLYAEEAARALGELGDPRAEPTLLRLLAQEAREARLAAACALGLVGTRGAVAPLLALKDGSGGLGEAAREAIRRIQGRLGEAGTGQLSVVPEAEAAGGLSVPVADGGELSLLPPRTRR